MSRPRSTEPLCCPDLPSPDGLVRLDMPTLILAWQNDTAHPIGVAQRLASLLPDATLVVAENDAAIRRWPEEVARFLDLDPPAALRCGSWVRRRQVAGNMHASPIASLSRP